MSAETVASIVLFLSVFYLLDRLVIWMVGRGLTTYRRRQRRGAHGAGAREPDFSGSERPPAA